MSAIRRSFVEKSAIISLIISIACNFANEPVSQREGVLIKFHALHVLFIRAWPTFRKIWVRYLAEVFRVSSLKCR